MPFPDDAIDANLQPANNGGDLWAFAEVFTNDWTTGVRVSRTYTTNISSPKSAAEQRYSLFDLPLLSMEAKIFAHSEREVGSLKAIAQRLTKARGLWPLYSDEMRVTAAADEDDTEIEIGDLALSRVSVGSFVLILIADHNSRPESNYYPHDADFLVTEVLDIDGNTIEVAALDRDIPAGARVFPLVRGRLNLNAGGSVVTDAAIELDVSILEHPGRSQLPAMWPANTTPSGVQTGLFSLPIFERLPSAGEPWSWGFVRRGDASTSGISYEIQTYGTRGLYTASFVVRSTTRAEAFDLIRFFDSRRGRTFAFWFLDPLSEYRAWTGVTSGTSIVARVGGIKADNDLKPYLYIRRTNGTVLICDVTSYTRVTEDLYLIQFANIGASPTANEIEKIGVAYLSRFDSDILAEEWLTTEKMDAGISIVELEDEKSLTIQYIEETDTADLLTQWTAGSCFAPEEPIPEGIYCCPEFSNPLNPELWRFTPESGEWEDLSGLITTGISDYSPWVRPFSFGNIDDKAIYLCGNVKRIGKAGDLTEIIRVSSSGLQLLGTNSSSISNNPFAPDFPGVISCLHVHEGFWYAAGFYSAGVDDSFEGRVVVFRLEANNMWELYANSDILTTPVTPQRFRTHAASGNLFLCCQSDTAGKLFGVGTGTLTDLDFDFAVTDIIPLIPNDEIWMTGGIPDGSGSTYGGGVAKYESEGVFSRRGGGFFNNLATTNPNVRPLVAYPGSGIVVGPSLFFAGAYYVCVKSGNIFYPNDTALMAYITDTVTTLPNGTGNALLGTFSGGRSWLQPEVFPADTVAQAWASDMCEYKGAMYVCGKFRKIRSASNNAEHIARNASASMDHAAVWSAVPGAPTGRNNMAFICAYTHDKNLSTNTHDRGTLE